MRNTSSTIIDENPSTTENPVLDAVLEVWREARRGYAMPAFAALDHKALEHYRGWLSFATALPRYDDFRYSFVGPRVVDYFGSNATGLTIREAYTAAGAGRNAIDSVLWMFRTVCFKHVPLRLTGSGGEYHGRWFPAYDTIYLPLSDSGMIANAVMCAFTTLD
jgi:hypothetical protein